MIESNIYLEMILHTNLDLTISGGVVPPKCQLKRKIGGVVPLERQIFPCLGGLRFPYAHINKHPLPD